MKTIASVLILLFLIKFSYSQNSNDYKIEKSIKINFINLKIISSGIYKPNGEKLLIGVGLSRQNDSISYLWKQYDKTDTIENSLLSYNDLLMKDAIEIPTTKFDNIASQLKKIDIEKINSSSSNDIMDGNRYCLTFSGNGYKITTEAHTPELATIKRGLTEYLSLCRKIWNLCEI